MWRSLTSSWRCHACAVLLGCGVLPLHCPGPPKFHQLAAAAAAGEKWNLPNEMEFEKAKWQLPAANCSCRRLRGDRTPTVQRVRTVTENYRHYRKMICTFCIFCNFCFFHGFSSYFSQNRFKTIPGSAVIIPGWCRAPENPRMHSGDIPNVLLPCRNVSNETCV